MTIDYQKNHDMLTAALNDIEFDNTDPYVVKTGFNNLKYGWKIILAYVWICRKTAMNSSDVLSVFSSAVSKRSLYSALTKLINADVYVKPKTEYVVYGCNIITPVHLRFSSSDVATALDLYTGSPLLTKLRTMIGSKFDASILDSKDLTPLFKLITFEIPSVAILLHVLGYTYTVNNPYINERLILGRVPNSSNMYLFYNSNYKILSFDTYVELASLGLLKSPLTTLQCAQLDVITNHIYEE